MPARISGRIKGRLRGPLLDNLMMRFLWRCRGSIKTKADRVVTQQRSDDVFLMNYTNDLSVADRKRIQQCRLYLRAATLADVCTIGGDRVERKVLEGERKRESKLIWPNQGDLTERHWRVWKKFLGTFTETGTRKLKEEFRLGGWKASHQHWQWTRNGTVITNHNDGSSYRFKKR